MEGPVRIRNNHAPHPFCGKYWLCSVAVVGGVYVAQGTMTIGNVQAFMQYSRQFGMPITQLSIVNVLQSTVAAAERVGKTS